MSNLDNIRNAFTLGGPLAACWNVKGGWTLDYQVSRLRAGDHLLPTVFCPLLENANDPSFWKDWLTVNQSALAFINQNRLPVTLRYGDWLDDFLVPPDQRGPFETSPLVHQLTSTGDLDSILQVCPLGPVAPYQALGKAIASTYWLQELAKHLRDASSFYILENNEPAIGKAEYYVRDGGGRDGYGIPLRYWRDNLPSLNIRVASYAAANPDPNNFETAIARAWEAKYQALTDALLNHLPPNLQGKSYTGGYAGLSGLAHAGLGKELHSYRRPQNDWDHSPWASSIHRYAEPSHRCYDDGSGSPWDWHDWVRSPAALIHNLAPLTDHLAQTRDPWHHDVSFYISNNRCRAALSGHGGYVFPNRVLGFARAVLWSIHPSSRATVLRWFASSKTQLTDRWFDADADPEDIRHLTVGDYWEVVPQVANEVWDSELLLWFWRHSQPVLSTDPPLCRQEYPPSIADTRSRLLTTDADPPRYGVKNNKPVDLWREAEGRLPLNVYAQAWRIDDQFLLYAWSPHRLRTNVTVLIPGLGSVPVPEVPPSGLFKLFPTNYEIR